LSDKPSWRFQGSPTRLGIKTASHPRLSFIHLPLPVRMTTLALLGLNPHLFQLTDQQESNIISETSLEPIAKSSDNTKRPVYTRWLVPTKYVPIDELSDDFDVQAWFQKFYGPDIVVVSTCGVPDGWVLIDGN
jgi:hypothetical protein